MLQCPAGLHWSYVSTSYIDSPPDLQWQEFVQHSCQQVNNNMSAKLVWVSTCMPIYTHTTHGRSKIIECTKNEEDNAGYKFYSKEKISHLQKSKYLCNETTTQNLTGSDFFVSKSRHKPTSEWRQRRLNAKLTWRYLVQLDAVTATVNSNSQFYYQSNSLEEHLLLKFLTFKH